ncbi:electron transfer flavoprotein subunit alpha/FixB family protein [Nigerium massiliense]|uniref:electron transfer flavoprotein subunit alpha/FixB family protein n=1 Tax=Nigerium massiliense TaxID=1522317 RepID=UPI00058F2706|nr:electron transfer flavoprotein subunit alpha/FixB family protein [Nigerium massiliense]
MSTYLLISRHRGTAELLRAASAIGEPITTVVVGDRALADEVAAGGVTGVRRVPRADDTPVEAYAAGVASLVARAEPGAVLASDDAGGRALLGAVAAALVAPVLAEVTAVARTAHGISVTRAVAGGIATETRTFAGPIALALDVSRRRASERATPRGAPDAAGALGSDAPRSGASQPGRVGGAPDGNDAAATTPEPAATVEEVAVTPLSVTVLDDRPAERDGDLATASRIVAVGRGLRAKDDLGLIADLADALDAEIACSQPLSDWLGWLPSDRLVGVTGRHVAPDLYVVLGISGQPQHTEGTRGASTVVAVNSDPDCPYVREADYAVVGDLYAIVPELIAALETAGGRARAR